MRIGVPTEVKNGESRVALTPAGARQLIAAGHEVVIQSGAGQGAFVPDADYEAVGARIGTVEDAWSADLVIKVKEPAPSEFPLLRDNILFAFLHLAANEPLAQALIEAGTTALSYDTVQKDDGTMPLLAPMSAIAGNLALLAGAYHLLTPNGGRGVLMGGAPGAPGARVVIIGAGVAGSRALEHGIEMGAEIVVLDINETRLAELSQQYGDRIRTRVSTPDAVAEEVCAADLVIGAVLVPGRRAPVVLPHSVLEQMRPGAVLVDIAIDQGGCFEDSRPTTHTEPVYKVGDVWMYCVTNMPGAVGSTATAALSHATLPYIEKVASGWQQAFEADSTLARSLNVGAGTLRHPAVAEAFPALPADLPAQDVPERA